MTDLRLVETASRKLAGRLLRRANRDAVAALALGEALAAGCAKDLSEMEGRAVVAALAPLLPAALALATRDPDEAIPLAEVAAMLRVTVGCVAAAARAGRVRLRIERIGRKRCVRVRDLDEILLPERVTDADGPLVRELAAAISASMPKARTTPSFMTSGEAAAALGMNRRQLWRAIDAGTFPVPVLRLGRALRFPADAVERAAATTSERKAV
jgi:predicted DNA-binding transcriptional regulator AlpA